jgi:hypothetical protein
MARQPLKSRLPSTGIGLGPGFLAQRPRAAALIAQCIATWNEVELQTGILLAGMLGVPFEPITAMYLNLANQRGKKKALDPIAKFVFSDKQHYTVYEAVMTARSSAESQRNDLAHGLFGVASDDPDGVIMITTTDHIKHMFEINRLRAKSGPFGRIDNAEYQNIRASIVHYTITDLEMILTEMETVHRIIRAQFMGFALAVVHRQNKQASERYQQLVAEPLIHQSLSSKPSNPRS